MANIIIEKKDLTYLQWAHARSSSGTAGTFLKSEETIDGTKRYYKLSNFDSEKGIVGHECVNEIIVARLLSILGIEHLAYQLIHADVEINGKRYETWLCASNDFKARGERKTALDHYYQVNAKPGESHYDFCVRAGWQAYIDTMLAVDFLILNRDRHGANIEVLQNGANKSIRIAPLFDHGLSLLCTCYTDEEIGAFDVLRDHPCQNFIGGRSSLDNLNLISDPGRIFAKRLEAKHKEAIFYGLAEVISEHLMEKQWKMIFSRWKYYEDFSNKRSKP